MIYCLVPKDELKDVKVADWINIENYNENKKFYKRKLQIFNNTINSSNMLIYKITILCHGSWRNNKYNRQGSNAEL